MLKAFLIYSVSFVSQLNGYPDTVPPQVVLVSPERMNQECAAGSWACYWPDKDIIYFPEACNKKMTVECKSALIHEVTHYMQDQAGVLATMCYEDAEKQAYANESEYLKRYGKTLNEVFGYPESLIKDLTTCKEVK